MRQLFFFGTLLLLSSCGVEYNPYVTKGKYHDLTSDSLNRIGQTRMDSFFPFSILFISDLHSHYRDVERAATLINESSAGVFTIVVGDITNMGLLKEYELAHESLIKINSPYLSVIGNHDALSNGKDVYRNMYGPFNYSFVYNNVKFILFNNNKAEFGKGTPNIQWLESQLTDAASYQHVVVVSHVPLDDPVLPDEVRTQLSDLIFNNNISLVVNGHNHNFQQAIQPTIDGTDSIHLTAGSIDKGYFIEASFESNSVTLKRYHF